MTKIHLAMLLLFTILSNHTATKDVPIPQSDAKVADCPSPDSNEFYSLCSGLRERKPLKEPIGDLLYEYELRLWQMACADPKGDILAGKEKVKTMWIKYGKQFRCRDDGFKYDGNILKFAVFAGFPEFVFDLIETYGIPVDYKDPIDCKTILQYVDDEYLVALKEHKPEKARNYKFIKETLVKLQNEQKSKN